MSTRVPVSQVPAAPADPADDPFAADEDPEMQGDFDAFTKWLNESLADSEVGNPGSSSTGDSKAPAGASAPAGPPGPPAEVPPAGTPSTDPKCAAAPADHPATLPKENPAPEVVDSASGSSKPCSKCHGATECT